MNRRKDLSKRQRFEVFKRDSFTCQYCGESAPDVVLNVDHIIPVAKGGKNAITNLITSCFDCNSGKSDKLLSDDSIAKKQLNQIKLIQERKQQIEMISEWAHTLLHDDEIEQINKMIAKLIGCHLNEIGVKEMRKRIKKHGFKTIIESMPGAYERYGDDFLIKFDTYLKYANEPDDIRHIMYSVGILRNRLKDMGQIHLYDSKNNRELVDRIRELDVSTNEYRKIVKEFTDYHDYNNTMLNYIDQYSYLAETRPNNG
jgi:hypothetical protein